MAAENRAVEKDARHGDIVSIERHASRNKGRTQSSGAASTTAKGLASGRTKTGISGIPKLIKDPQEAVDAISGSEETIGDARLSDVDQWGRSEKTRQLARSMFAPIYDNWFRVEWEGLEKIPTEGGALLVSNHAGAIPPDALVIMHGIEKELRRPVYGLADHLFRTVPFLGTAWSRAGGVAAHPDNAYRILRQDKQLALVFPEGSKGTSKTFAHRYRLQRFGRGGFVEIAMRSGVPVVPIAVVGAEEAMPTAFNMPGVARLLGLPYAPLTFNWMLMGPFLGTVGYFPAKFRLRVLDPVHFNVAPDQERYSKSRIMEEAESIRVRIQETLYDMLAHRHNPWTG